MQRVLVLFVLVFSALSMPSYAATPTAAEYGRVINLAGKQRMLSQKATKEALLIMVGYQAERNAHNLLQTSALFDLTLSGLKTGSPALRLPASRDPYILTQIDKVNGLWKPLHERFKGIAEGQARHVDELDILAVSSGQVLKQMNQVVLLFEQHGAKTGLAKAPELARVINLAGRQRMLIQKMTKEYLLIFLGYQVEQMQLNLLESFSVFERSLKGLRDGDPTLILPANEDANIERQLQHVESLWLSFRPMLEKAAIAGQMGIKSPDLEAVAEQNLPLLLAMNKAVSMFESKTADVSP